jgi:hypothetical protein
MDLIDKVREISARIDKQLEHIQTEEATKNAFIMPFIAALGYDVFNPLEVIPEFTADIGTKKGEKVDYAIKKDGKVIILMECKWSGADLHQSHASQLYRYFSVTEARFGILTNGLQYEFYSDIDQPNKMDEKPFFLFDMLDFQEHQIAELKKFTKSAFSLDDILTTASTLKYTGALKKILEDELRSPSENFVKFFASQVYAGRLTQPVLTQFAEIVKEARKQFINEKINERLKSALTATEPNAPAAPAAQPVAADDKAAEEHGGIDTTQEEIDGFNIIKAILRKTVDLKRITLRDTKSYCGVLLDDNNRKPICRLHFNYSKKYIGLFTGRQEERVQIEGLDDIFNYAERIQATVLELETAQT